MKDCFVTDAKWIFLVWNQTEIFCRHFKQSIFLTDWHDLCSKLDLLISANMQHHSSSWRSMRRRKNSSVQCFNDNQWNFRYNFVNVSDHLGLLLEYYRTVHVTRNWNKNILDNICRQRVSALETFVCGEASTFLCLWLNLHLGKVFLHRIIRPVYFELINDKFWKTTSCRCIRFVLPCRTLPNDLMWGVIRTSVEPNFMSQLS